MDPFELTAQHNSIISFIIQHYEELFETPEVTAALDQFLQTLGTGSKSKSGGPGVAHAKAIVGDVASAAAVPPQPLPSDINTERSSAVPAETENENQAELDDEGQAATSEATVVN